MSVLLKAETMAGGALLEALDFALEETLANVLDPNTSAKQARKITAIITIKPDVHRDMGTLTFEVKTSTAAPVPVETSIFIDRDKVTGKAVAAERRSGEDPEPPVDADADKRLKFQTR
jgi:hypothetical protein